MESIEILSVFSRVESDCFFLGEVISEFVLSVESDERDEGEVKGIDEALNVVGGKCREAVRLIEDEESLSEYVGEFVNGFSRLQELVLGFIGLGKEFFADREDDLKKDKIVSAYKHIEEMMKKFIGVVTSINRVIADEGNDLSEDPDDEELITDVIIDKIDGILSDCVSVIDDYIDVDFTDSVVVSETGKRMITTLKSLRKQLKAVKYDTNVGEYLKEAYLRLITNSRTAHYYEMLLAKDEIIKIYTRLREYLGLGKVATLKELLSNEVQNSPLPESPNGLNATESINDSVPIVVKVNTSPTKESNIKSDEPVQEPEIVIRDMGEDISKTSDSELLTEGTETCESSNELEFFEKRARSRSEYEGVLDSPPLPKKRDSDPVKRLKLPSRQIIEAEKKEKKSPRRLKDQSPGKKTSASPRKSPRKSNKDNKKSIASPRKVEKSPRKANKDEKSRIESPESTRRKRTRKAGRSGSVKLNKFTDYAANPKKKKSRKRSDSVKSIPLDEQYTEAIVQFVAEKLDIKWDKSNKNTKEEIAGFIKIQLSSFKEDAPLNIQAKQDNDEKSNEHGRKKSKVGRSNTKSKAPRDDPKLIKGLCPDLETALDAVLSKVTEIATIYHSEMIPEATNLISEFYVPINQYYLIFDKILMNLGMAYSEDPPMLKSLHLFSDKLTTGNGDVLEFDRSLILNEVYFRFIKENILTFLLRNYKKLFYISHSMHATISILEDDNAVMTRQFIAIMNNTLQILVNMKNSVATLKEICKLFKNSEISHVEQVIDTEEIYVSVWEAHFSETKNGLTDPWTPATPSQLIVRLTSPVVSMNPKFTETVLMIYDHVLDPKTLVYYIIARFSPPEDKFAEKERKTIQLMTIAFLNKWIRRYYYHLNEELLDTIQTFCRDKVNPVFPESARNISNELENFSIYFKLKMLDDIPTKSRFSEVFHPESILTYNPQIIASHLTLIEGELYKSIHERELLNQNWSKSKEQFVAQNVVELMQRTNKVSFWVATSILLHENSKDRIKAVEAFISIANELCELSNYNTLMGVLAGLMMGPVSRLEKTFSKISKSSREVLGDLQKLMDPSQSFKHFREQVKGRQTLIPFLGVVLSDLTFMDEGNPDLMSEGEVNLPKHQMVCEAISALKKDQHKFTVEVDFSLNIYTQLYELPSLSNNELYVLSYVYEPSKTGGTIRMN